MAFVVKYTKSSRTKQQPKIVDDATLLRRVNDAIENSNDVNDVDLTISVLDGNVTLAGSAKTFADKWGSVSAAHQSRPRHVTDNIVVRPTLR